MRGQPASQVCHAERGEESVLVRGGVELQILRFAQDDSEGPRRTAEWNCGGEVVMAGDRRATLCASRGEVAMARDRRATLRTSRGPRPKAKPRGYRLSEWKLNVKRNRRAGWAFCCSRQFARRRCGQGHRGPWLSSRSCPLPDGHPETMKMRGAPWSAAA